MNHLMLNDCLSWFIYYDDLMSIHTRPIYLWPSALIFGALLTYLLFFILYKLVIPALEPGTTQSPLHLSFVTAPSKATNIRPTSVQKPRTDQSISTSETIDKRIKTTKDKRAQPQISSKKSATKPDPIDKPDVLPGPLEQEPTTLTISDKRESAVTAQPMLQRTVQPSQPVSLGEVTSMPRFTHPFKPHYPKKMRRMGREGVVEVALTVDHNGRIVEKSIIKSAGIEFDTAAHDALQSVEFTPAKINGQNVAVRFNLPIRFVLY